MNIVTRFAGAAGIVTAVASGMILIAAADATLADTQRIWGAIQLPPAGPPPPPAAAPGTKFPAPTAGSAGAAIRDHRGESVTTRPPGSLAGQNVVVRDHTDPIRARIDYIKQHPPTASYCQPNFPPGACWQGFTYRDATGHRKVFYIAFEHIKGPPIPGEMDRFFKELEKEDAKFLALQKVAPGPGGDKRASDQRFSILQGGRQVTDQRGSVRRTGTAVDNRIQEVVGRGITDHRNAGP